jgi:hypothetical protein
VVKLLARVLESGVKRIEGSPGFMAPPSPVWDDAIMKIKLLTDSLNSLTDGKAEGP